jgi:tetratricopeptide (TPR) repeat protein
MRAYNNLGQILFKQGKIDQSIKVHRKGLLFIPNSSILHCNLGLLLDRQGNRTEAIKEVNTAIRIDPNSPKIRRAMEAILKKGN